MAKKNQTNFDPKTVLLSGKNLVEASAGTGKTYSIAILVLRLLLEKEIKIQQILMVTFTNAAVAELEERIRRFTRSAYRAIDQDQKIDPDIQSVLQYAVETKGKEKTKQLLKSAANFLDETAIMTIHGFCQKTLTELAFETDQIFDSTLITNTGEIIEDEVNKFWRRYITTLDLKILEPLIFKEVAGSKNEQKKEPPLRESIINVVRSHLAGKEYLYFNCKKEYENDEAFLKDIQSSADDFKSILIKIYCHAISTVSAAIKNFKLSKSILSFDDLISKMHRALSAEDNTRLIQQLQKKYKAVFIDEFQDTDRLQYEIFNTAFQNDTILFYIGDPKQSIYAFRSADVFTYFRARSGVNNVYAMNTNYRSSEKMIGAMNDFFLPVPGFDMFEFNSDDEMEGIRYVPVNSPSPNTKGSLLKAGQEESGISIIRKKNDDELMSLLQQQMYDLFEGPYTISERGLTRPVHPSDIGILVRSHSQAKKVKESLSKIGITAVEVSEKKIFNSLQAKEIVFVLEAIRDVSRSNINKALLTSFTRFKIEDFKTTDDEKLIERFRAYKNCWNESGVYVAMSRFISDFNIAFDLLQNKPANGDRTLSNLYQLMEILHETEYYKKLDPEELILWLKRQIEEGADMDEYEQRVESDEESVKIVTVHSSKGLEYNIVIAPYLDYLIKRSAERIKSFRDPLTSKHFSARYCDLDDYQKQLAEQQEKQEFRRLIYVAVTRAVFKCIIFKSKRNDDSALRGLMTGKNLRFEVSTDVEENLQPRISSTAKQETFPVILPLPELQIAGNNWTKMSYTMLAADSIYKIQTGISVSQSDYDEFIFKQLDKGHITGNLLHFILENISFSEADKWKYVIESAIKRFAPGKSDLYNENLVLLLNNLMNARLQTRGASFSLSEIPQNKRLHELEFDFPVTTFSPKVLNELSDVETEINVGFYSHLEGIMNGKIDLFFEQNGKYYVLDWKSNFLGNKLSDYDQNGLQKAMNEHNYHLQYLIYSVAVKKYLKSRIPDFSYERDFGGVFYLFIRGIRESSPNGIFYRLPASQQINRLETILDLEYSGSK